MVCFIKINFSENIFLTSLIPFFQSAKVVFYRRFKPSLTLTPPILPNQLLVSLYHKSPNANHFMSYLIIFHLPLAISDNKSQSLLI